MTKTVGRVVCPKSGHPVQSSDIYLSSSNLNFLHGINNLANILNVLLVLKLFQLLNGVLL